jgi:hypothetical protein
MRRVKMKKIIILGLLVFVLFLSACSPKITSGEVYDKEYRKAFVTVSVYPVVTYNGKTSTTTMVPYTVYYPERWVIFIKSFEDGEWITEDFYVSETVYNSINIGDMFEYDENRGDLTDEPHTKEKAED